MLSARTLQYVVSIYVLLIISSSDVGAEETEYVAGQLVCRVTNSVYIDTINVGYGTTSESFLPGISSYLLLAPPELNAESLAAVIASEPYVVYCEPNYILAAPEPVQGSQPFIDFDRTGTFNGQTAAAQVELASAHSLSSGAGVTVAVVDVGVNANHPVLLGATVTGFDFVDQDPVAHDEPGGSASGHGTFIAGVIRLVAPEAGIASYRVLDTAGRGDGFTIARAIVTAVNAQCKVINLSMVMSGVHSGVDHAIEYARAHDVMVIAAAGNDSTEVDRFPASDSYVLSVAAVDSNNLKTAFSSYGGKVDVCAPGAHVYAPYDDSLFAWWNGTSFAAPFVSGQAALLYAARPAATWNEVRDAIVGTSVSLDSLNPDYAGELGSGLINPPAAVLEVALAMCGDFNEDGNGPDLSDLTAFINYLFLGGPSPTTLSIGNVDGTAEVDLNDAIYLINYLFLGGPDPACPESR